MVCPPTSYQPFADNACILLEGWSKVMEWSEFIISIIMVLWALSLVVNRKIIEKRILEVENRVDKLEQRSRSVGPRR